MLLQKGLVELFKKVYKRKKRCFYCGAPADYLVSGGTKPCCTSRAFNCPGYKKWFGDKIKNKYKEYPERIEMQRKIGKEVHNRKSVIEKKRKSMIDLHENDSEFIKNYNKGRVIYRNLVEKLAKEGKHWQGPGNSYTHCHLKARELYYKPRCENCGCTKQLHYHLYDMDLHMHNIDEDFTNLSEDNWSVLCAPCHGLVHRKERED